MKIAILTITSIIAWSTIALIGAYDGWWLKRVAEPGDAEVFMRWLVTTINDRNAVNAAVILIEDGEIVNEFYSTTVDIIDENTLFPTASLSKWITAAGVMRLVESGQIDLDKSISTYLNRWQLPPSEFSNEAVTPRLLLAHSSGLTDRLGFGDYLPTENVPSLVQTLQNPRASSNKEAVVKLGRIPGTEYQYSGGGYGILQLLIEDVSGKDFTSFIQGEVFEPLMMSRSTYSNIANFTNISHSYDTNGEKAPLYQYAVAGATGLSSTASDLARFAIAQVNPEHFHDFLAPATIQTMLKPAGFANGQPVRGLGPKLYKIPSGGFLAGHDGGNDPAISSTLRINPSSNDAIVVLITGHPTLAFEIGFYWNYWQAGIIDRGLGEVVIASAVPAILIGACVILLLATLHVIIRTRAW